MRFVNWLIARNKITIFKENFGTMMHTKLTLIVGLCFCTAIFGQKQITEKFQSDLLQDIRTIQIHLPQGYDKDSLSNYPLTIVLDAEYLFDLYVGNAKLFSYADRAPKQIIVGIEMAETREADTSIDENRQSTLTGKSKNFIQFIKEELLLHLEGTYRTSPFLTIVGNGASANLLTHFFKDENPIFNAYLCLNPTFSQDIALHMQSYTLNKLRSIDNTYYFYMNDGQFMNNSKKQQIKVLDNYLEALNIQNLNIKYDVMESSPSIISAMSEAIPRALNEIFEIYSRISPEEYETKIKDLSPIEAITYLENKYIEIDYLFGINMGIRTSDIRALEDLIIEKENGDHLKTFGKMILNLYPYSSLGHYYLGLYYETGKDWKRALQEYRLGYGKMDPADPDADAFYANVQRMLQKD